MNRTTPALAALFLAAMATPALAAGPFEDARQSLAAGDMDSVLLSVTMGAISINAQDDDGYTLLHYAARQGSAVAVDALLDRGADPAIKAKDGSTPVMLATDPQVRGKLLAAINAHAATPK